MDRQIDHCYLTSFTEDDLPSENAIAIFRWWNGVFTAEGNIPTRSSFKPFDHPRCLPNIVLQDIEYNPFRVRDRVIGTNVVNMGNVNTTGQYVDEQNGHEQMLARLSLLVETKKPYLVMNEEMLWASKNYSHYATLALPLSSDGIVVSQVLHYMDFTRS